VKLSSIISWLLLSSFFVLFTPRQIWHECDHDHKTDSSHEVSIDHDDCFACDYGLGFIESKGELRFHLTKQQIPALDLRSESFLSAGRFYSFSHRGPPNA